MKTMLRKSTGRTPLLVGLALVALTCTVCAFPYLPLRGRSANTGASAGAFGEAQTFEDYYKGFFSPSGNLLALMAKGRVDIVEISTRRKVSSIALAKSVLLGAAFSPDGRLLALSYRGADSVGRVGLWESATGKEVLKLSATDQDWRRNLEDLSFSASGQTLATNIGGVARLWDVSTGSELKRFSLSNATVDAISAERVLLSPDGRWLAAHMKAQGQGRHYDAVHVWETSTGRDRKLETNVYRDWRFSPDSKMLVLTAVTDNGKPTERSAVEVWETGSWQRNRVFDVPRSWQGAFTLTSSPDGTLLAVGGRRGFGIFSLRTGHLLAEGSHSQTTSGRGSEMTYDLSRIEFSPDGRRLLTAGNEGFVKIWKADGALAGKAF